MNCQDISMLPEVLLDWYAGYHRSLPWRETQNPYHIWISEVMLQQTRVEAVKGYYTRFLQAFPTVQDLANAPEAQIYKLWEGLGYYSRARNLQRAARVIVQEYNGVFPGEYHQVLSLPGIGEYTAGAVCSIAFQQKTPAVDGNVLRLFSRLTDDHTPVDHPAMKKKITQMLKEIYPNRAGEFTQALMELGATVCGPNRLPDCENCPCKCFCLGYQNGTMEKLPVKSPKKIRRQEKMTVFLLKCADSYAMEKRPDNGLLAGLWQFPNTSGHLPLQEAMEHLSKRNIAVKDVFRQVNKKHIFTHIQWNMVGYYMEVSSCVDNLCWKTAEEIERETALPTAFRQFWIER